MFGMGPAPMFEFLSIGIDSQVLDEEIEKAKIDVIKEKAGLQALLRIKAAQENDCEFGVCQE